MAKSSDILLIAAAAGVAIFAANKFGNNAGIRNDAKTDRVEIRTDYRELKQSEKTDRTDIRWDNMSEMWGNFLDKFGNKDTSLKGGSTTYTPPVVKINSSSSPTNQSNKSPFLKGSSSSENMTMATGGTGTGTNVLTTIKQAIITPAKEKSLLKKVFTPKNVVNAAITSRPMLNVAKNIFSTGAKLLKR